MSPPRERRKFGRRTTNILAWILVAGRPRLPCVVRNLTSVGAFCEMDPPGWLPLRIELLLDDQLIPCELRHISLRGIGITFDQPESTTDEKPGGLDIIDTSEWTAAAGRRSSLPATYWKR